MNLLLRHFFLAGCCVALGLPFHGGAAEKFNSAYISEVLTENRRGLKDDDGDRSPWIELYNGSSSTIAFKGWFLTDSRTNLTKWAIPAIELLPEKYLLVFASGKKRTNDLAHLHTSFRLKRQTDYVALVGPKTNVVSEFNLPRQLPDISYGRVRGEPYLHGPMREPTPERPNATRGPGFAGEVAFSRPSGTFTNLFSVQLSNTTKSAVIRYTLDGKLPTTNATVYTTPLVISNSTQLRARAYQEGLLPGPVSSTTYLALHTNVLGFRSTSPLLVMDTFGVDAPTSSRGTSVQLAFFEPAKGKTALTQLPTLTTRGGFHVRGSTSSGMPQVGFALHFVDEHNQDRELSPLGLPTESEWVLYAPGAVEPVLIHNPFVHQLSREMGHYSPRTRFVEVFLSRGPGPITEAHYAGLYVLEEKIKIGRNRVNIDRLGSEDLTPPKVTGYVLKFDRLGQGEGGLMAHGDRGIVYVEPKEQVINLPQRAPQRDYLQKYLTQFNAAMRDQNWKDPVKGYRAYFDVNAAIDFHIVELLSGNVDALVLSTYFYKPRTGKITYGPHWDFDRALGSTDTRDANPRVWSTGPFFGGEWWPQLFADVDFWQLWVDRWQEARLSHFSLTNLNRLVDSLCNEVREAQPRQYKRWNLQARGGSYQSEINLMKDWLSNRVNFVDEQLVQRPVLSLPGGPVAAGAKLTFSAPTNTTIYFTLDGSDPRLSQGAVASSAIAYKQPLELKTNTHIIVRAWNDKRRQTDGPPASTPWSSRVMAKYNIRTP
ncbi:MAG TPA: CotH kinase family protein [Candidatus Saccharimonadales bacterium]|nr:CotH kinase family protein [Candidatus Saccharimonadales bacterium]